MMNECPICGKELVESDIDLVAFCPVNNPHQHIFVINLMPGMGESYVYRGYEVHAMDMDTQQRTPRTVVYQINPDNFPDDDLSNTNNPLYDQPAHLSYPEIEQVLNRLDQDKTVN